MGSEAVSLDDKYALEQGQVFLTAIQALVRLPMMQRRRDVAEGLNTAGFISGYRGSPLGGLDQQLWRAEPFLKEHHIHFEPGINEDLAATAVWGSQQNELAGDSKYDGVYAMWYGKGPGVDRCGDVFRHGNMAGSSKHGGVLLLAGDDHGAKSSTTAAQCEFAFMDAMMPVLSPAGIQEFLDLGIYGWALSRFSGAWVGFKVIGETAESTASCSIDPNRVQVRYPSPEEFEMPSGGLNIRWPDDRFQQEDRLHRHKIYAALAFARANNLNKVIFGSKKPRFGIITAGKSYLDVRQALDDLGITEELACELGITLLKIGMVWPLEKEIVRQFAEGLEEILVVEEKRAVIENQLKEQLYNWRSDVRPRVVGKFDETGEWILPSTGELTPSRIARAIAKRIAPFHRSEDIEQRLKFLDRKERALEARHSSIKRLPWFCSGCPHNTSTKVPDGSRAMAGIGCHWMVLWMDRNTETFTQMGAEGVPWIGQAPFSKTKHVFANLGDGTYYHSGILAIRAAVAAGVNITYKILYNDAVAMTGGQPVEGSLSPARITRQLQGEGVDRIIVMTDEPDKYPAGTEWADGVVIKHRDELERVQKELRLLDGVSILLYDQTCAAEKRRRRKRGLYPDPPKRVFINDLVCEGCGDCSVKSNCVSIVPVETEFGRKRAIDQSSCNKDFSCLNGFCPSFVTVEGGEIRKVKPGTGAALAAEGAPWQVLPEPELPPLDKPYSLLVTGVGGTGVVTIGALLGMAAHIEGKGVTILDQTGLAQKGGAVISHLRIAKRADDLHAVRISAGNADLVLGCDLVVSADFDALSKMTRGESKAIVNSHEVMTGEFTHKPDLHFPTDELRDLIIESTGAGNAEFLDATRLATALLGDSIATNLFILGYAWQRGLIPVGETAILEAIALNGIAVDANSRAFTWGRRAAVDLPAVQKVIQPAELPESHRISESLQDLVERRAAFLTNYQNAAYGARYEALIRKVQAIEERVFPGREDLTLAVARNYFKLLAIKDEYEVARLYSAPEFRHKLAEQFTGNYRLKLNLAPPLLSRKDPETGHLIKREFGPWVFTLFKILQRLKGLRGTPFDLFGYSQDRRHERALIEEYEATLGEVLAKLAPHNYEIAVELASSPTKIRGFGHIKEANIQAAKICEVELLDAFRQPDNTKSAAE